MNTKIVLIGAGNIATFFASKIKKSTFEIVQIISKNEEHAKTLASSIACKYANTINDIDSTADIIILATPDTYLLELNNLLCFKNKVVIHTAGSIALKELQNISEHIACIWPVQSIHKNRLPQNEVPLVVNATDAVSKIVVLDVANAISSIVEYCNDEQKEYLHLACVFANNFTNHMVALSEQLCVENKVPFELLQQLIKDTFEKINVQSPHNLQTGPAIRNDENTIEKHLLLLKDKPHMLDIYKAITRSIQDKNN